MESWKVILGTDGKYEVSNLGNVRRSDTLRLLKASPNTKGYYRVTIGKIQYVHRLVASAFIENPFHLPQVNHKDENPANNNADNLEWCNNKYNCNYGAHKANISSSWYNNYYHFSLIAVPRDLNNVIRFDSMQDAESFILGKIKSESPNSARAVREKIRLSYRASERQSLLCSHGYYWFQPDTLSSTADKDILSYVQTLKIKTLEQKQAKRREKWRKQISKRLLRDSEETKR